MAVRHYYSALSTALLAISFSSISLAGINHIEPPMVAIKGGSFDMGSANGSGNEQPVHQVAIKPFYMAQYEVTVKEYRLFVEATGHVNSDDENTKCMSWEKLEDKDPGFGIKFDRGSWDNPAYAPSEYHPVLCVSSEDAIAYAKWLTQQTGKPYRLPTESEWEYAARAGSKTDYFFGDHQEQLCQFGNVYDQRGRKAILEEFNQSANYAQCDDGVAYTSVVGMYKPNAFGLYDTIGNVGEIVADCEHISYEGAPLDGSAWTSQCDLFNGSEVMQIHRGGAYGVWSSPARVRSAARGHMGLDLRSSLGEGFRLAMDYSTAQHAAKPTATFIEGLAAAQQKEKLKREKLNQFPQKPSDVKLSKMATAQHYKLSWTAPIGSSDISYNIYRTDTYKGTYKLIASGEKTEHVIAIDNAIRRQQYAISSVKDGMESLMSDAIATGNVSKSAPGRIEAEDFNDMSGISVGNVGPEEDEYESLNLTGAGGVNKGNWTEYEIRVDDSGWYQLQFRLASATGSKGFDLVMNDEQVSTTAVPATGGWRKWQTVKGSKVELKAGSYTVKVFAIDGGWKMNWLEIEKVSG